MRSNLVLKALGALSLGAALLYMPVTSAQASPPESEAPASLDLSTLTPSAVIGATQPLAQGQLEALQVSHVQPVAFMDTTSGAQVQASIEAISKIKASAELSSRVNAAMPVAPPAQDGQDGMGFGGSSSHVDIMTLQYGYVLGALPLLQIAKADEFASYLAELKKLSAYHKHYTSATSAKIEAYLAAAAAGKIDQVAYTAMLREATQGIASSADASGQRVHGYLLLGLWSGFISMSNEAGKTPANIFAVGEALEQLLLKDSSYGSSDQRLAGQLKVLNTVLKESPVSKEKVSTSIKVILATKADDN